MSQATRYPFSIIREAIAKRDTDVLDFAIGRTLPTPPAHVLEMLDREPRLALRRAGAGDLAAFTASASGMLAREFDTDVDPACILPAPGGRAAISAVAASCITPGDGVLVTEPSYPAFARVASMHHGIVHAVRLDPERGFAPDLEPLAAALPTIRVAGLNYPNNPTAALLDPDVIGALASRLPADAVLFNDAAYGPLTYDTPPASLLAVDTPQPRLELHPLSKLFGTGAMPVCFLAGDADLIETLRRAGDFAWTPPSVLQVRVATACLDDAAHLAALRASSGERVARLRTTLGKLGFTPHPTPAGFYVLCPLPETIAGHPTDSPWPATHDLLDRFGVAVMPYETGGDQYLRFTTLHEDGELEQLAQRLSSAGLRDGETPKRRNAETPK